MGNFNLSETKSPWKSGTLVVWRTVNQAHASFLPDDNSGYIHLVSDPTVVGKDNGQNAAREAAFREGMPNYQIGAEFSSTLAFVPGTKDKPATVERVKFSTNPPTGLTREAVRRWIDAPGIWKEATFEQKDTIITVATGEKDPGKAVPKFDSTTKGSLHEYNVKVPGNNILQVWDLRGW